jgi:hypothetical protein
MPHQLKCSVATGFLMDFLMGQLLIGKKLHGMNLGIYEKKFALRPI